MDELTVLAVAAGRGDGASLREFVRRSQVEVWRLCAHLAGRGSADDLTQEVYLRALPALGAFRAECSARTWLLAIARRTVVDVLRSDRRLRRLDAASFDSSSGARAVDPADRILLHALVRSLEEERRSAFVLTQVLGLSYAEAARVCGCPVGTIRSRVARARGDLVRRITEEVS